MPRGANPLEFISTQGVSGGTEEVYARLCDLSGPGKVLVNYAFGRQVNDWLADVYPKCLERLAREGLTRWYGTRGNYAIRYIPNRMLDITLLESYEGAHERKRVRVYDIRHWFDTTLEKALGRFAFDRCEVITPRSEETGFCGELAHQLCHDLDELGLRPTQWHGPGAVAAMLMARNKVADHNPPQPPEMEELFRHAYYGGRIQALRVGEIGPALRYDLRSAYASAMVNLPSLKGSWVDLTPTRACKHCLCLVSWSTPKGCDLTPFPWRDAQGHIHYPREGRGWQWGSLVDAAQQGPWDVRIERACHLRASDEGARPFAYLRDLHEQRKALRGTVKADLLKAVMVSSYGKLAQQGGSFTRGNRSCRSLAWAGMVTAQVQAWLLEAALKAPDRACHFLTDGLLVSGEAPLGLPLGDDLGQWSEEAYDGLWCFQPAFYVTACDQREHPMGLPADLVRCYESHAAGAPEGLGLAAVDAWRERGLYGSVSFDDRVYCGMAMARVRGWDNWRTWVDLEREMVLRPALGFSGPFAGQGDDPLSFQWNAWDLATDYSALSSPYVPRGAQLVDERWEEVEAIRAAEECG